MGMGKACRQESNLLEVEVPQAAVVTDYSDAIVIDQEVTSESKSQLSGTD